MKELRQVQSFVIEYHRLTQDRVVTPFDSPRDAAAYRILLEELRVDNDVEIAVLLSNSIETLQRTHSRYFSGHEVAQAS